MPYIVLEALAAGMPMIATAVGGIPEIFGEDSPALVRPDAGEIAAKMVEATGDVTAYRAHMPSHSDLDQRFSAKVMAKQIEAAYFGVLERNTR